MYQTPTKRGSMKLHRTYRVASSRNGVLYLVRDDGYLIDSGIES